jgi:hypothetical protein
MPRLAAFDSTVLVLRRVVRGEACATLDSQGVLEEGIIHESSSVISEI